MIEVLTQELIWISVVFVWIIALGIWTLVYLAGVMSKAHTPLKRPPELSEDVLMDMKDEINRETTNE